MIMASRDFSTEIQIRALEGEKGQPFKVKRNCEVMRTARKGRSSVYILEGSRQKRFKEAERGRRRSYLELALVRGINASNAPVARLCGFTVDGGVNIPSLRTRVQKHMRLIEGNIQATSCTSFCVPQVDHP